MNPKELKQIFQRGKCPSRETMRLYNEGKLHSKTTHEVEKHLLECSLCASAIDGLSARRITDVTNVSSNINKRLAVYMNTPPTTPILSRFGVAMIVSSIIIALGLTVWLITANSDAPEKAPADTGTLTQYEPPAVQSNTQTIPDQTGERSQEKGTVSVNEPATPSVATNKPQPQGGEENLPATEPGNEKTLAVNPPAASNTIAEPDVPSTNTRIASGDQFLRIKSVMVYPPITHNEQKSKSQNNDGQLNRTQNSKGNFELDEMPTYPGGNEALKNYILTNFHPQKEDKDLLKRKTTGVLFQVNAKTGEVTGATLSFPVSPLTDAELLRVVNNMPYWNPGKKRGLVDEMLAITFE